MRQQEKLKYPPYPLSTVELEKRASRYFRMSSEQTMKVSIFIQEYIFIFLHWQFDLIYFFMLMKKGSNGCLSLAYELFQPGSFTAYHDLDDRTINRLCILKQLIYKEGSADQSAISDLLLMVLIIAISFHGFFFLLLYLLQGLNVCK